MSQSTYYTESSSIDTCSSDTDSPIVTSDSDDESECVFPMDNLSIRSDVTSVLSDVGKVECTSQVQDPVVILTHQMLENFIKSNKDKISLPIGYTSEQKQYFLDTMLAMGLELIRVPGSGIVVKSDNPEQRVPFVRHFDLSPSSSARLIGASQALNQRSRRPTLNLGEEASRAYNSGRTGGVLTCGKPRIPLPPRSVDFLQHRQSLPVYNYRQQILNMIKKNRFCVIKGPAGCGKSTQIPQYILEDCQSTNTPCRIVVCLPRRVSVVAITDRVAMERGEKVGHTVGYQVRLESCSSPVETLLNFCTGSVLIRALAHPGKFLLQSVTHIILDEAHCRTKHQDFLLNCFRDLAEENPHIKFICVTEDISMGWLNAYLSQPACPEISIDGGTFVVDVLYIEHILGLKHISKNGVVAVYTPKRDNHPEVMMANAKKYNVDDLIKNVFSRELIEESIHDFLLYVRNGEIDPNYPHSETKVTMLMACAANGLTEDVEKLLDAGGDPDQVSNNGRNALGWSHAFYQADTALYLTEYTHDEILADRLGKNSQKEVRLVQTYYRRCETDGIDFELIVNLAKYLHVSDASLGSILVFLPAYEDLDVLHGKIMAHCQYWSSAAIVVYMLHKHIQTGDQRAVFEKEEEGIRKIILTTAISQSSLTFEDVKFVIDSGRKRAPSDVFIQGKPTCWISQADAEQRKSRAGRSFPGVCFRLYTQRTFLEKFENYTLPEMQSANLLSLCLHSRSVLRNEVKIAKFFRYLPHPPRKERVETAVQTLQQLGAIEDDEQLSELGFHLLDYPLDPRWAKAALYSCIFKCMDPILTIASYMSYDDAFVVPKHPKDRQEAMQRRLELSDGTMSDYIAILKAFHRWEMERVSRDGDVSAFCKENYLTCSTFDVVYGIRTRLLGQLRASGFVRNKGVFDVKDLNMYADNWAVVKAVLLMTLYPNICAARRIPQMFYDGKTNNIYPHPSSVLSPVIQRAHWKDFLPTDFVVFDEKIETISKTGKSVAAIMGCCAINTATVVLLAGELYSKCEVKRLLNSPVQGAAEFMEPEAEHETKEPQTHLKRLIKLDKWLAFFGNDVALKHVATFRQRIKCMIIRRLIRPDMFPTPMENLVLEALVDILTEEDARIGFKKAYVGQWPKLVAGNLLSAPRGGFLFSHEQGESSSDDTD